MALVSGYIEAPSQGITQAAQAIRLPSQATALDQSLVEIPEGERKRPPIDLVGKLAALGTNLTSTAALQIVEDPDDGSLLYLVLNTEAGVTVPRLFKVADLSPVAITMDAGAQTYLNTNAPGPHQDIAITQAVDYTILTNRKVVVTVDPSLNATRTPEAIIFVKSGAFGKTYTVTVTKNGGSPITFYYKTPSGASSADTGYTQTAVVSRMMLISAGFTWASEAFPGTYGPGTNGIEYSRGDTALLAAGFTITYGDSIVLLQCATDFTITCDDSQGGAAMVVLKDSTQAYSNLPAKAFQDFTIKIDPTAKDGSLPSGAYFLKYTLVGTTSGQASSGVWKEVVGPGSQKGLLISTMPVGLIKITGTWHCQPLGWTNRTVGNEILSPDPDFVGGTIKDVGYAFNRFAIISDEECFLTAVDNPFRCYPSTMTTTIDSDPISKVTPGASRAHFYSIIPFNHDFIIFGRRKQALLAAPEGVAVTSSTLSLDLITSYETVNQSMDAALNLRPTFSDRYAYYPMLRGPNYYAIYEVALDRLSGKPLSEDLTPHVPKLLPSTIDRSAKIESSFMIVYGQSGSSNLFAHLFRYAGSGYEYKRVQNAWHTWNLPTGWTLSGITQRGTLMYYLMRAPDGTAWMGTMETAPLARDPDPSSTIQTLLDLRMTQAQMVSVTYDPIALLSTITLPYAVSPTHQIAASTPVVSYPEGYLGQITGIAGNTLTVRGDWRTTNFYVGHKYISTWTLSTIFYVGQDGRPQHGGTLDLRRFKADLSSTSYLSCVTKAGNRLNTRTYYLKNNSVGTPMLFNGYWEVPLATSNLTATISIVNDSHLPHRIQGFEWFGEFVAKSQRVT